MEKETARATIGFIIFLVIMFFVVLTTIESYAVITTNPILALSGITLALITNLMLISLFKK